MTTEELELLIGQVKAIHQNGDAAATFFAKVNEPENREMIKHLYGIVFRVKLRRTCTNCFMDAWHEIMWKLKDIKNLKRELMGDFKLKQGQILHCQKVAPQTTWQNLTDDLAIQHLAETPEKIEMFESFPADWKKQVANYKKAQKGKEIKEDEKPEDEKPDESGTGEAV